MPKGKNKEDSAERRSKEERDRARVDRAERKGVAFPTLMTDLASKTDTGRVYSRKIPDEHREEVEHLIERYERKWAKQWSETQRLHALGSQPEEVIGRATALIEEIKATLIDLGLRVQPKECIEGVSGVIVERGEGTQTLIVYKFEYDAFRLRAENKFKVGDIQGAVEDATIALSLTQMHKKAVGKPFSFYEEIQLLFLRGTLRQKLGDLEGACRDLRATAAGIRCSEIRVNFPWDDTPSLCDVVACFLEVLVLLKVKEGAKRPHFTQKEQEKWQKELRFGMYNKDLYKCAGCGAKPSRTVQLCLCARCKMAFFCGRDCQKESWKEHKLRCATGTKRIFHHMVMDDEKPVIEEIVADVGCFALRSDKAAGVLVCDPVTGRMFDSFSDSEVFFFQADREVIRSLMVSADPGTPKEFVMNMNCTGKMSLHGEVAALARARGASPDSRFQLWLEKEDIFH